uniref:Uncharacterized protein n=1 Tax=Anguilla anguilla TaxID=7936 RepID=A0A0E9W5K6_ANGAN
MSPHKKLRKPKTITTVHRHRPLLFKSPHIS